jgi:hypothetical protein
MSGIQCKTVALLARMALIGALGSGFAATSALSASAHDRLAASGTEQCQIVGAISHRCLNFDSDSAWPEGLSDYHGSNGG